MLMGQEILRRMQINLDGLNHRNFNVARELFENSKEEIYDEVNQRLIDALNRLYSEGYKNVELRRLSSTFRRGDLLRVLGIQ
jgi:hypothetical protein